MSYPATLNGLTFRYSYGVPRFTSLPLDKPLPKGHFLVKVKAASFNPVDYKLNNFYPLSFVPKEKGLGRDLSGEIVAVSEAGGIPEGYNVGDRVFCFNTSILNKPGLADYYVLNTAHDLYAKIPEHLSFEEAAAVPCVSLAALQSLRAASKILTKDSKILILGGSTGVGAATIQLSKVLYGIENIVATCSDAGSQRVIGFGAKKTISYQNKDKMLAEITQEGPFDFVLDAVGGRDVLDHSSKFLAKDHLFATVSGDVGGKSLADYRALYHFPRMIFRILFGKYYGINYSMISIPSNNSLLQQLAQLLGEKKLTIPIDSTYDRADYKQAWDKLLSARAKGKIILTFSD